MLVTGLKKNTVQLQLYNGCKAVKQTFITFKNRENTSKGFLQWYHDIMRDFPD